MTTGVLLVNLGTPNSSSPKDVRRYLTEFLTDGRVIDLPFLQRHLLVKGVIVPKRAKTSAASYANIWQANGSPLLFHTDNLKKALQDKLGKSYHVEIAMRYQKPSIQTALETLQHSHIDELIILPLFPQYASATVGSIYEKVFALLKKWPTFPHLRFINSFYDEPLMIEAFYDLAKQLDYTSYDHILMSFHGLPVNQLKKCLPLHPCQKTPNCCQVLSPTNKNCYGAQCYHMAYLLAEKMQLSKKDYSVCFQSRLGKTPWIEPYTSNLLQELAREKKDRVLVFSPSFICDCLETTFEIGVEYAHEFTQLGGTALDLVPGLNDHPLWIEALENLIKNAGLKKSARALAIYQES
jgi:ferrochelatase